MKFTIFLLAVSLFWIGCNKRVELVNNPSTEFIQYLIRQGQHYCDNNSFRKVSVSEMKFIVRFDSTAIYQTISAENQYDINKLFGFSDNNKDHHSFSARFGWRWSDGELRLFAYVYNAGVTESKEVSIVEIGEDLVCSISVEGDSYLFSVGDISLTMPRSSQTEKGEGYQLYPYFGGDETAPHDISIMMKQLN